MIRNCWERFPGGVVLIAIMCGILISFMIYGTSELVDQQHEKHYITEMSKSNGCVAYKVSLSEKGVNYVSVSNVIQEDNGDVVYIINGDGTIRIHGNSLIWTYNNGNVETFSNGTITICE